MGAGAASNALASAILQPADVCKARMQASSQPGTFLSTARDIARTQGMLSLWLPGITASMLRECVYCGPRVGLYPTVRDWVAPHVGERAGSAETGVVTKSTAAILTGTFGSILGNPTDIVKVRMQVDGGRYSSAFAAFGQVAHDEGVSTLMLKGLGPSVTRGAVMAVAELVTYDQTKASFKELGVSEGFGLHVTCSLITGVVATTAAAPFDLIKTRCMNAAGDLSVATALRQILKQDGMRGLFRGWVPAYCRLGPHALIQFPLLEQIRQLLGLGNF